MSWFRLDDSGWSHPKVLAVGNRAFGAWCRAGQWASQQLSNCFVAASVCRLIEPATSVWGALVEAGLLERCEGGYLIHDYLAYNPSKEQVEAKRRAQRDGGRAGANARWNRLDDGSTHGSTHKSTHGSPQDYLNGPVPSRPDPILSEGSQATGPTETDPEETRPGAPPSRPPPSKRTKQLPIKVPTPKDLTWGIWREMYANSRRKYGKFVANAGAPKAIETLAERALSEAQSELVDRGTPGDPLPLVEELLRHWFASYLRDDGFNEFLSGKRHAIEYLPKSLSEYGLPKGWGMGPRGGALSLLAGMGAINE